VPKLLNSTVITHTVCLFHRQEYRLQPLLVTTVLLSINNALYTLEMHFQTMAD